MPSTSAAVVVYGSREFADSLGLPNTAVCCATLHDVAGLFNTAQKVLITRASSPDDPDLTYLSRLASILPMRIIAVTDLVDDDTLVRFARTNCRGVLSSQPPAETVERAINAVLADEYWLPRKVMARVMRDYVTHIQPNSLTKREGEIVRLISQRLNNQQIADTLAITRETVRWHVRTIYSKLGIRDRGVLGQHVNPSSAKKRDARAAIS